MDYIYFDEKGPQGQFNISRPFKWEQKLAYASDNMHSYVGNCFFVSQNDLNSIESGYKMLEKEYISDKNKTIELKGSIILKQQFEFGVASMKNKSTIFYSRLFDLLMKFKTNNLLFSISKISILIDSKLSNWIYFVDEINSEVDARILKYIITKYMEIEAPEHVIKVLTSPNSSPYFLLKTIRKDMKKIIIENKSNERMSRQLNSYSEIIQLINDTINLKTSNSSIQFNSMKFDWRKVTFAFDLWLSEQTFLKKSTPENINLILDRGIPELPFKSFNLKKISSDCKSNEIIGLRIADVLVALAGGYITALRKYSLHDPEKKSETKRLPKEFFELSKDQFELIKKIYKFYFNGGKYNFIVDTFFDAEVVFESFIFYVNQYLTIDEYNKVSTEKHIENQWKENYENGKDRFNQMMDSSIIIREEYGSVKNAVECGQLRPI